MVEYITLAIQIVLGFAALIQVLLLYMTFAMATEYLSQHRRKYLMENKLKLVESTIRLHNDLLLNYERTFSMDYDLQERLKKYNDYKTLREVLGEFWKKDDHFRPERRKIKNEISVNLSLLKNKEVTKLYRKQEEAAVFLYNRPISLKQLKDLKTQPYGDDLFRVLPFSIYQGEIPEAFKFIECHRLLSIALKSLYFKL